MELDDLKKTWKEAGTQAPGTQTLSPDLVENIRSRKYRSRLKKITIPETIGSLVCLAAALFVGLSFDQLDTTLLQGAGALCIGLLVIVPIISYLSIGRMMGTGSLTGAHREMLQSFAMQKVRFIKLQKLNVVVSYLLLVLVILLLPKLVNGTDVSGNKYFWIFSFTIGYIFLVFYAKWVQRGYQQVLRGAEELLLDLEVNHTPAGGGRSHEKG